MAVARRFGSIEEVIASLDPSFPVFCLFPEAIRRQARAFVDGFPGRVLYAVKCNAHPIVLKAVFESGITGFDTASPREIAQVAELLDDAECHFNHPVKGRAAIETASVVYGVTHFVVDHESELEKLHEIVGPEQTVSVRFATPGMGAVYDLSTKFGAGPEEASALLRRVASSGGTPALSFHVGSQCGDPDAYARAIALAGGIVAEARVDLAYLNVGGGFPARYQSDVPPLERYFEVIGETARGVLPGVPLWCEPGRAVVAEAGVLLAQVYLRKDERLYINDGIYGTLSEVRDSALRPPVAAYGKGHVLTAPKRPFTLLGPTCDSIDVLPDAFALPGDIAEGDWIAFGSVGAYSLAIATGFNGFVTDVVVEVEGLPGSASQTSSLSHSAASAAK